MATMLAGPVEPCVSDEQFEAMRKRFRDVGASLTDGQLLTLADDYHGILRWRREVRGRFAHGPELDRSMPPLPASEAPYDLD